MIPKNLVDWNIESVHALVQQGVYESDGFDFKECLPDPRDPLCKERLTKTCCAFANSYGGFLIFGVKNDSSLSATERMVGIEASIDFPEHFGNFPSKGDPAVQWEFKNPAIVLPNGRKIHLAYIPKSWSAPHAYFNYKKTWEFCKRTNKGNEPMSMEEIRANFLNYYEKRIKLQLLKAEIEQLRGNASAIANADVTNSGKYYSLVTLNLEVINLVLADTYTVMSQIPELITYLSEIRSQARLVNTQMDLLFRQVTQPLSGIESVIQKHNTNVLPNCSRIIENCNLALAALGKILISNE